MGAKIFTCDYVSSEIEWYGVQDFEDDHIAIRTYDIHGALSEYLNRWFWLPGQLRCPSFYINGKTWMSLTPLEVQSMVVPLACAEGKVGTSGLGMGYFALRCANDTCVDEVHVYENNPHVIRFFNDHFSDREGFDRIIIHEQDINEVEGEEFTFFFADHYQFLGCEQCLEDAVSFPERNAVDTYRWWGMEKALAHLVMRQLYYESWDMDWLGFHENQFFAQWLLAEREVGDRAPVRLCTLFDDRYDNEYLEHFMDVTDYEVDRWEVLHA